VVTAKPFRGLKLWMTLRLLGRREVGGHVDRTMEVARHLASRVADDPRFEDCGAPVDLASVCVRYLPPWARGRTRSARLRGRARLRLNRVQTRIQHAVERRGFAWFPIVRLRGEVYPLRCSTTAAPRATSTTLAHIVTVARARL
jgi:glutamate/tyrosine decarboxylase-like PLP-dependent enzyme